MTSSEKGWKGKKNQLRKLQDRNHPLTVLAGMDSTLHVSGAAEWSVHGLSHGTDVFRHIFKGLVFMLELLHIHHSLRPVCILHLPAS